MQRVFLVLTSWGRAATDFQGHKVSKPGEFQDLLWETILLQTSPDDCLIINCLRIDFYLTETEGY